MHSWCPQAIAEGALPSSNKFKEMQDELEYKQMQLENTQVSEHGPVFTR
jgi:intraflagellar transport protein 74